MENPDKDKIQKLLAMAKDLASQRTDAGLLKASEVLLLTIEEGCKDPAVMVTAARYMLQGPHMSEYLTKARAVFLVDKAVFRDPANLMILENAVFCYELLMNDFPEKSDDMIGICLKILDLNPDSVEAMITLANHRRHPSVSLALSEAVKMLEWAKEVEPANILVDYTLARLYEEAGQYAKAKALYKHINADAKPNLKSTVHAKNKRYRKYGVN